MTLDLNISRSRAPRTRLSEFMAWAKGNDNSPSYSNRYAVSFATPNILRSGRYVTRYNLETGDNGKYLNLYADTVNLPSKQVTTGSITNVGSTYNYATSSTFSQINISFIMPRNHKTRMIFERWISIMSNDANQYTDYYDDYVCPNLRIYKFERGGGPEFSIPTEWLKELKKMGIDTDRVVRYKDDQLVGVYDIRNVFPFNVGSMSLNNEQAGLLKMDVGFYYERYRFYGRSDIDSMGLPYFYGGSAATGAARNPNANPSKTESTTDIPTSASRTGTTTNPTAGRATTGDGNDGKPAS